MKAGHKFLFDETSVISKVDQYWDRVVLEALEIHLDYSVINRDIDLSLSAFWQQALVHVSCFLCVCFNFLAASWNREEERMFLISVDIYLNWSVLDLSAVCFNFFWHCRWLGIFQSKAWSLFLTVLQFLLVRKPKNIFFCKSNFVGLKFLNLEIPLLK